MPKESLPITTESNIPRVIGNILLALTFGTVIAVVLLGSYKIQEMVHASFHGW